MDFTVWKEPWAFAWLEVIPLIWNMYIDRANNLNFT